MSSPPDDERLSEPRAVSPPPDAAPTPVHPEALSATADRERVSEPVDPLTLKSLVVEAVSTVYDPEIPVNIYELGLIYDITIDAASMVEIRMTLTAPNCPVAFMLPLEVERRVREVPGVTGVHVDLVWDPPWDRDRMSDAAKLQLGLL